MGLMASRLVTFQLSLHEAMANGLFPPSSTVSVRGDFTQWEPIYFLLDNDGDGLFSIAVPIDGNAGDVVRFKYVLSVGGQDVWEALPDREYTLGPADVNAVASPQPHIFDTLLPVAPQNVTTGTRVVSVTVTTLAQATPYRVFVYDSFIGWDGNAQINDRGVIYATSLPASEAAWVTLPTKISATGSTGTFRALIDQLPAATPIYYRAFATNARGTKMGRVEVLTTGPVPNTAQLASATTSENSDALTKKVRISWGLGSNQSAGNVYILRVGANGTTIRSVSSLPTNFDDDSVDAGASYEYYAGFESSTGQRGRSIALPALTVSSWSTPSAPSASGVSQLPGTALLTWATNPTAAYYEISLGSGTAAKVLGQTTATHFLATQLPGHSALTVDEGGVHLGNAAFRITAFNGGGLRASSTVNVAILAPLEADGTANPAKVRPDRNTSRLLLLARSGQFASSSTSRTLGASEPVRNMWAAKSASPAAQFTAAGAAIRSYFVTAEDLSDNDWLVDNTVMATVDRTSPYVLASSTAPKVIPRYADANFPASYAGHFIDGVRYQSIINARIYNDTNNAAEHVAEAYLMPGARLRLQVLFYTNFKGTILRIGGPTLYYRFFSKIGLYAAQSARANGGWASMTQLINADFSQNFIKTEIDAGEEELAVFRVRIPAFMGGSSTTLVVAAERA
jgi:hypothetical protein